ncbi:hypothetical protein M9458_014568, partial [Cirrhinus mrigala]
IGRLTVTRASLSTPPSSRVPHWHQRRPLERRSRRCATDTENGKAAQNRERSPLRTGHSTCSRPGSAHKSSARKKERGAGEQDAGARHHLRLK